jgi:hypothetical protein
MKIIAAIAFATALVGCATTEKGQALSVISVHEAPGKTKTADMHRGKGLDHPGLQGLRGGGD